MNSQLPYRKLVKAEKNIMIVYYKRKINHGTITLTVTEEGISTL